MTEPGINVNLYYAFGTYALFSLILGIWLATHKRPPKTIALYWLLFTWFCAVQAVLVWNLELIPAATDGITYFRNASDIATSGFHPAVIAQYLETRIPNIGISVYTFLEAGLIYLTLSSFPLVHLANILMATIAVYYAARFATLTIGPHAQKYVVVGFVIYFAWYWNVLQNLREAPILLFLGIALVHYMLWWQWGKLRHLIVTSGAALLSMLFRPENLLLIVAIAGLTVLYRHRSTIKRFAWSIVLLPPLAYLAVDVAFVVRYGNPIRSINSGRLRRVEAGHHLDLPDYSVSSVGDLLTQMPETFRYFLVPIWPWEIQAGLMFTKAYAHSLSALVLAILGIIGFIRLKKALGQNAHLAKPLGILLVGFAGIAALYSTVDIGAGVASRHSAFFFYFLLASFVPIGLWSLRNVGARIIAPSTRQRRPARLTETEAA